MDWGVVVGVDYHPVSGEDAGFLKFRDGLAYVQTKAGGAGTAASEAPALSGWTNEKNGGFNHKLYARVFELLLRLRDKGNTVLVVEHEPETIAIADHVVDLGPGAGTKGGEVMFEGSVEGLRAMRYDGSPVAITAGQLKRTALTSRDIDRQGFPHYFLKEINYFDVDEDTARRKLTVTRPPASVGLPGRVSGPPTLVSSLISGLMSTLRSSCVSDTSTTITHSCTSTCVAASPNAQTICFVVSPSNLAVAAAAPNTPVVEVMCQPA